MTWKVATLALAFTAGCGPALIEIDPKNVVDVAVRPASGQLLYCPGDPFLVEVVARLSDGTSCSTRDPSRGCLGQRDVLLEPDQVRARAIGASPQGGDDRFVFVPDGDPLATADTGVSLKAWIERRGVKSPEGDSKLKPVYDCRMESLFREAHPAQGPAAAPGPEMTVAITSLSTPFYPDAALVRVDVSGQRLYFVSPSQDRPVRLTTKGQTGSTGTLGAAGAAGAAGEDRSKTAGVCELGGAGLKGADGTAGGPGGDGGAGGVVHVQLDERAADKLKKRVVIANLGGDSGAGGAGGPGGPGGPGGAGGPIGPDCTSTVGAAGEAGSAGAAGSPGKAGAAGPAPDEAAKPRETLFENELEAIERIEAQGAR